jgi:hypothetical protein
MRNDTVVGLFSIALGGLYGAEALRIKDATIGNAWEPRMFPLGIAFCLLVIGIASLVIDRRKAAAGISGGKPKPKDPGYWKLIAGTIALCAVYSFIFEWWGYVLSTICFLFCLLTLANGPRRWKKNAVISFVFTVTMYAIFVHVFGITLPTIIGGWF